jgi:arylsulfatase A-like enzyme
MDTHTPDPRFAAAAAIAALAVGLGAAGCGSAAAPEAVVLIVIDAARADHLGAYGYARPTSPNIDSRVAAGLLFERAYTTSPWTLPAFGSLLTGRLPTGHAAGFEAEGDLAGGPSEVAAARRFRTLDPRLPTLAEILAARGFATGAFVTNPFLHPRFGLARGFTDYDHYESSNTEVRRADVVTDLSLAWIDEHAGGPFFLLVHLFDPHLDYDAPPPFRGRFSGTEDGAGGPRPPARGLWPIRNAVAELSAGERDLITAGYDEEIAFVDAQIERLLAGLERRGLHERTLVILTADHGEELFDHGGFEHGHTMYDEVLRVPLILWGLGVEPGREAAPVSLIDIRPTVLDALGIELEDDAEALPGISLLSARSRPPAGQPPRPVIAEAPLYGPRAKAIVEWPYKAILDLESGEARLFDLSADPGERNDLAAARPEELRGLLGVLADRIAAATPGESAPAELDPELLRRLRALGYIR